MNMETYEGGQQAPALPRKEQRKEIGASKETRDGPTGPELLATVQGSWGRLRDRPSQRHEPQKVALPHPALGRALKTRGDAYRTSMRAAGSPHFVRNRLLPSGPPPEQPTSGSEFSFTHGQPRGAPRGTKAGDPFDVRSLGGSLRGCGNGVLLKESPHAVSIGGFYSETTQTRRNLRPRTASPKHRASPSPAKSSTRGAERKPLRAPASFSLPRVPQAGSLCSRS